MAIIDLALEQPGAPIYVRKEIVHNHYVVREFQRRGVRFVDSEQEVPEGAVCVFSAHGDIIAVLQRRFTGPLRPHVAGRREHGRRERRGERAGDPRRPAARPAR
ncbi:hypothetical protein ACIBLA_09850 [Streptomyces sp. NPDC050433]